MKISCLIIKWGWIFTSQIRDGHIYDVTSFIQIRFTPFAFLTAPLFSPLSFSACKIHCFTACTLSFSSCSMANNLSFQLIALFPLSGFMNLSIWAIVQKLSIRKLARDVKHNLSQTFNQSSAQYCHTICALAANCIEIQWALSRCVIYCIYLHLIATIHCQGSFLFMAGCTIVSQ